MEYYVQENVGKDAWLLLITWEELLLCFFIFLAKKSNPKGPPNPNVERLMLAALAAKGLNTGAGLDSDWTLLRPRDLPERGTTPSWPWKSLNAISKFGPSSKMGPFAPRAWKLKEPTSSISSLETLLVRINYEEERKRLTGTKKLTDEKENCVVSLMFLKNGHLSTSSWSKEFDDHNDSVK